MDAGEAGKQVLLSPEHSDFRWAPYDDAYAALRYDDDKTALWELDARLRAGDLPQSWRAADRADQRGRGGW